MLKDNIIRKHPILLAAVIIIILCAGNYFNNDTFWLIPLGNSILDNGIPVKEVLTFHSSMDMISQQWLSALAFAGIYRLVGRVGLIIFAMAISAVFAAVMLKLCKSFAGDTQSAYTMWAISTILFVLIFGTLRPQLFSCILLAATLLVLQQYKNGATPLVLCALPCISVLLINTHAAMWLMMFVLMLPYAAEGIWSRIKMLKKLPLECKPIKLLPLGISAVVSLFVGFCNPYGLTAMTYIFRSYGVSAINEMVMEMDAPSLSNASLLVVAMIVYVALASMKWKNIGVADFFLFAGTLLMALMTKRSFAEFLIAATPVIACAWRDYKPKKQLIPDAYIKVLPIGMTAFVCALGIVCASVTMATTTLNDACPNTVPSLVDYAEANTAISENDLIFADYDGGGYLEFRGYKPFIDARAEVFIPANNHEDDYLGQLRAMYTDYISAKLLVEYYRFDYIFVNNGTQLYRYLINSDNTTYLLLQDAGDTSLWQRTESVSN